MPESCVLDVFRFGRPRVLLVPRNWSGTALVVSSMTIRYSLCTVAVAAAAVLAVGCSNSTGNDDDAATTAEAAATPLTTAATASSSSAKPSSVDATTFTQSGGCGDVFFWAGTEDGAVAITVEISQESRSAVSATEQPFSASDRGTKVRLLRGRSLSGAFCTDVWPADHRIDDEDVVTTATGSITLPPKGPCGGRGTLQLDEALHPEVGSVYQLVMTATEIGCYAG